MNSNNRLEIAADIISSCMKMNQIGINQGSSGNISSRFEDGFLITPSGIAYEALQPEDIVFIDKNGISEPDTVPSSEWRFHKAIYDCRPDLNAVVHTHAIYSTTVAIMGKDIPAIHYMVGVAGGNNIPCVPYATYGTSELSDYVKQGFENRQAILLEHHGMIAAERSLSSALWLATEVETMAHMYVNLLQADAVRILPDEEMERVLEKFKNYGLREKD
ncbi:L-fuculose-phosphate aldolase [Spongorhabdus nitratireducens]